MKVGLFGLGRMGLPMAKHIAAAGHDVVATDVTDDAKERATAAGLTVGSVGDMIDCQVVCSSLPNTPDVHTVYVEPGGVFDTVSRGTVCVDLSTISIAGSREIAARARNNGIHFLDAPVSGTSIHVEAGTAVVMVGGDETALERARPVIEPFAATVEHVGDNGAGLELKLITNRLLTIHLAGIAGAIIELEQMGLDVERCAEIIRSGAVPRLLDYKAGALINRDFTPLFTVDLMRKDLAIAAEELPGSALSELSRQLLEQAHDAGLGDEDLAALITVVEQAQRH